MVAPRSPSQFAKKKTCIWYHVCVYQPMPFMGKTQRWKRKRTHWLRHFYDVIFTDVSQSLGIGFSNRIHRASLHVLIEPTANAWMRNPRKRLENCSCPLEMAVDLPAFPQLFSPQFRLFARPSNVYWFCSTSLLRMSTWLHSYFRPYPSAHKLFPNQLFEMIAVIHPFDLH